MGAAGVPGVHDRLAGDSAPDVPWQSTAGIGARSSGDSTGHGPTDGTGPITVPKVARGWAGMGWPERASGEPDAAPAGAAPAPAALPCQNSNNCPKTGGSGYRLRRSVTVLRGAVGAAVETRMTVDGEGEGLDSDGRFWQRQEDGTWQRLLGDLSANERRGAFALRRNVEAFSDHYERERCGFMTLTAKERQITPLEFGEMWHGLRKHELGWVESYVRVLEPQRRGSPHYHLLVATPWNLQPDSFDWEAYSEAREAQKRGDIAARREFTKRYAESADPRLRALWRELREVCERYGFGRSEILPFRKGKEAVAEYIGGYLESGLEFRRPEWKGARRIEYDRQASKEWKACSVRFGWVSAGASAWRSRVGEVAMAVGASDMDGLRRVFGSKWGYRLRGAIMTSPESEWREFLFYLAGAHGGRVEAKARLIVGGDVRLWYPGFELERAEIAVE